MGVRISIYRDVVFREARRISTPRRVEIANQIASEAQANAPVLTGEYRNGIGVEVSGDNVVVVGSDATAIHKEYGTSDTPAHAVLTDAARGHGKYSGMSPKGSRRR